MPVVLRVADRASSPVVWIDWTTHYGASDGPREVLWTYFGGKPWDKRQSYAWHSPCYSLPNVRTPALLQHGERDIDHCEEIHQDLTDLNRPGGSCHLPPRRPRHRGTGLSGRPHAPRSGLVSEVDRRELANNAERANQVQKR